MVTFVEFMVFWKNSKDCVILTCVKFLGQTISNRIFWGSSFPHMKKMHFWTLHFCKWSLCFTNFDAQLQLWLCLTSRFFNLPFPFQKPRKRPCSFFSGSWEFVFWWLLRKNEKEKLKLSRENENETILNLETGGQKLDSHSKIFEQLWGHAVHSGAMCKVRDALIETPSSRACVLSTHCRVV